MKSSKALGRYLFAQTNSLISFTFSLLSLSLIITWSLLDANAKVGAGTGVGVGVGLGVDSGTLSQSPSMASLHQLTKPSP